MNRLIHTLSAVHFAAECLEFHPDGHQQRFLETSAKRVILNCTRQWGKTTICAAAAIHKAFTIPETLILVASPSERQSRIFLRAAAQFVRKLDIRPRSDGDNAASILLPNNSRIVGIPGEMPGTVRGFSALSLLIFDEAAQVSDELYAALRPMLATSGGSLWLLSTPYGKRGFFHREWTQGGRRWTRFTVPATECPRIPADFLDEEREVLGEQYFNQEYLCQFHATYDALFDEEQVRRRLSDDTLPLFPEGI